MKLLALLLGAVVLSGCSGGGTDEVTIPLYRGEPNHDDAALQGRLAVIDRCLVVLTSGGAAVLPAFPASATQWDSGSETLTLGGTQVRPGQRVLFGGSGAQNWRRLDWERQPRESCITSEVWIAGDHVTVQP